MRLLTLDNSKIEKNKKYGWMTFGLHLAPHTVSGYNVCPHASKGCAAACLNTAGRGRMDVVQNARIRKTKMFKEGKNNFLQFLQKDIDMAKRKAKREYLTPCFRLNLTSDISWERYGIIQNNPDVQFYDYTKNQVRAVKAASGEYRFPENYHLTFSKSEDHNVQLIQALVGYGVNVAVVFNKKADKWWEGMRTINGDKHDLRFLDGKNRIIALKAKGDAINDQTGFTVNL
jgi:hypothetical protein|tara:strand:+ start:159 stop:848 length:690 start_codon:yes stop_codon:yes gene_type:complete